MIGVYICRDKAGNVLYVGASGDTQKRLTAHKNKAPWWGKVDSVEEIPTDSRFLALDLERQKILELDPAHNITSKGGAQATTKVRGPVVMPRTQILARVIEEHGNVANLAKACGVNHMTMSGIWRGICFPSSKLIARLMTVTGLTFDQLFKVEVIGGATNPDEWREFRGWRSEPKMMQKPRAVA